MARRKLPLLRLVLVCSLGYCCFGALRASEKESTTYAIRAGKVYTGRRGDSGAGVLEDATVVVRDGRFEAVGRKIQIEPGMRIIHLPAHVLIPGLIDGETTLASDRGDTLRSIAPEVRALDGWDFFADRRTLLKGGITTVYVSPGIPAAPGNNVRLISGRGGIVKTAGFADDPSKRILRRDSGFQVTLGEMSRTQPSIYDPPVGATPDRPFEVLPLTLPQSRPGEYLALRRLFKKSLDYREAVGEWLAGRGTLPAWDLEASSLYPLFSGADYLRVRANRARDLFRMIALAKKYGLRLALESGAEVERLQPYLLREGIPVIFQGAFRAGRIPGGDLTRPTTEGLFDERAFLRLARAGVQVVLHSPTDSEVKDLILQAAAAVGMGMDPLEALRAITSSPAEVLGVSEEVGTIEPGRHADFVVLGGEPFGPEGRPQAVVIQGEVVYQEVPPLDEDSVVIRCGRILSGRGKEIPAGIIIVKQGKIEYVGPGALLGSLEGAARVVDAQDRTVVPGFIDCGSTAGTHADSLAPTGVVGSGGSGGKGGATFRLAQSVDPEDPALREMARAGITCVLISPEGGAAVRGQISALKVAAADPKKAVLKEYAAMLFGATSTSLLKKAKAYHDDWKKYEVSKKQAAEEAAKAASGKSASSGKSPREPPKEPKRNENYEPFGPLFEGKVPAVVPASNRASVESTLKVYREQYGIKVIFHGLTGLHTDKDLGVAADAIRRSAEGVLLDPPFLQSLPGKVLNRPRELSERGVSLAFRSQAATGGRFLPVRVAYAVREGLDARKALRAMTHDAAKLFGIDDRVGSIEKGKDADLVFLSGEPFSITSRVMEVMVDGKLVFEVKDRESDADDGND